MRIVEFDAGLALRTEPEAICHRPKHLILDIKPGDFLTGFYDFNENCRFWYRATELGGTEFLSDDIEKWMYENNITYPFQNKEDAMLFELTWG